MPRKKLIRSDFLPYHVTLRVNNREKFPIPLDSMWKLLSSECLNLNWVYNCRFHAVVLMPNHVHILLSVPEFDLGKVMDVMVAQLTRSSHMYSGRSGRLFGGPYHWTIIESARYFGHALKYVYRNPVKARICEKVEDYPYSTLHGLIGRSPLVTPIHLTSIGMELGLPMETGVTDNTLEWLNQPFSTEVDSIIRIGLSKKIFEDLRDRKTRKPFEILKTLH